MLKSNLIKLPTPIDYFAEYEKNSIYIKRDDRTDLLLGGNKARKLELFLGDALVKKSTVIVTYGSPSSNHCRMTAAAANKIGMRCVLILSEQGEVNYNGNYLLFDLLDVETVVSRVEDVKEKIKTVMKNLAENGETPYFIEGGGHGDLGTEAYKLAFDEIFKQIEDVDYIFLASGTGTTQAGLVAGKLKSSVETQIVGISIARGNPRCKEVVAASVKSFLGDEFDFDEIQQNVIVQDEYIGNGYGDFYQEVFETIKFVAKKSSIMLDPIYTGKAFYGMMDFIKKNKISNKRILFVHTGGLPNVFNYSEDFKEYSK